MGNDSESQSNTDDCDSDPDDDITEPGHGVGFPTEQGDGPLRSLTPKNHTQTWLQLGSLSTKKASQLLKERVKHIFCDEVRRTSSATLVFNPYSDLK